ncbi:hypothetical protein [Rhodopirellula europaea]|uniref:hypothetical protein n=1 Tax=Rhodopirellula europaea TaxID=1263866 RepID=UPI003D2B7782
MNDRSKLTNTIIVLMGLGSASVAALMISIAAAVYTQSGESSPMEARNWFEVVVHDDSSPFSEIQHYTVQGIDFSHHFRFHYAELDDLTPIIEQHELRPNRSGDPIQIHGLPKWYAPPSANMDSATFSRDGSEPILFVVDHAKQIAFFEFIHP